MGDDPDPTGPRMSDITWHLPDPERQPEFYADVASKRLVAFVVDTIVILAISLLALPFTAFTGLFFFPVLMAIEFRASDGQRFDLGLAVAHTLGLTISFALPILQVVSIVLMLTGPRGQGLSDLVLGSVAVNRRAAM
jgi:uncharacterized RDD family membrane protein YckC